MLSQPKIPKVAGLVIPTEEQVAMAVMAEIGHRTRDHQHHSGSSFPDRTESRTARSAAFLSSARLSRFDLDVYGDILADSENRFRSSPKRQIKVAAP